MPSSVSSSKRWGCAPSLSTTSTTRRSAKPSRRRHLRKISRLTSSTPTRALKTSWWLKCQWIDFGHSSKASKQTANMAISPSPTRAHPTTRSRPSPRRLSAETKAQAGRPAFLKVRIQRAAGYRHTVPRVRVRSFLTAAAHRRGRRRQRRSVRLTMNEPCPLRDSVLACEGHALVTGGPGSGKTTIALRKAVKRIQQGMTPGQSALFLSFARGSGAHPRRGQARSYSSRARTTFHSDLPLLLLGHPQGARVPARCSAQTVDFAAAG